MNILFLGITPSPIISTLMKYGCDKVLALESPVDVDYLKENKIEFAVSYGYRHIVKKPVIDYLKWRIINLHIALLPWNKGADPNLWSFLENTPKGVTIHYIDEGLDTGDIIIQREVGAYPLDTLQSSYDRLSSEMERLFREHWVLISSGNITSYPQTGRGSYHKVSDKQAFEYLLTDGWDTPVRDLVGKVIRSNP